MARESAGIKYRGITTIAQSSIINTLDFADGDIETSSSHIDMTSIRNTQSRYVQELLQNIDRL